MKVSDLSFNSNNNSFKVFCFFLSFCFHCIVIYSLFFVQSFKNQYDLLPTVMVDLVSFDQQNIFEEIKNDSSLTNDMPLTVKSPNGAKRKITRIKPDMSLKSKPENLEDIVSKIEKEKKISAFKNIEKKKKDKTAQEEKSLEAKPLLDITMQYSKNDGSKEKIAQALSSIKQRVREQDKVRQSLFAQRIRSGLYRTPLALYRTIVASKLEENWVFNDILAKIDQKLEVHILIKILKNGEITDIVYQKKSGNLYFDESAKKAIYKSVPLPSLPGNMTYYEVVLSFIPRGLK